MAQLTANGNHAVPSISSMPAIPGRAGRPGIRLRVHRARRHARARPGARGAHLRAAAPLPGERPGTAGAAGTDRNAARTPRPGPPSARRTARPAMGRTSCPGGITTSRDAGRPGPGRRPARARCRSACQRPPSTCSRRGSRRRRTRRPGLPTPGQPTPACRRRPADAGPGTPSPGNGAYIASSPYPAAGSSPFAGPGSTPFPTGGASYPDQPAPFPGWTLHNTPGAPGGRPPAPGGPRGPRGPRRRRGSRAGHPDDPGRLTASGAGFRAAVEDLPGDRAAARRTGFGRAWRAERACGIVSVRGGDRRRLQRAAAPGQAGQPGPPAQGRPATPAHDAGQQRGVRRRSRISGISGVFGSRGLRVQARLRSGRPCRRCSAAGRRAGRSG